MPQSAEKTLKSILTALDTLLVQPAITPSLTIARTGLYGGKAASVVMVAGQRSAGWSSNSLLGDVAQYLDLSQQRLNEVVAATTYYLRSSSAADDTGQTGALTVRIVYLDAAGNQHVKTVALDGQTPVSLGDGHSYFQWAEVASVGTGRVAAGNITISTRSGAGDPLPAEIVEYIAAGGNRSLSCRYRVPTGYTAYLVGWGASAVGGGDHDARLRAQVFADDHTLSDAFHFLDVAYITNQTQWDSDLESIPVPAGAEIKISGIPTVVAAGNRINAHFHLLLIAN